MLSTSLIVGFLILKSYIRPLLALYCTAIMLVLLFARWVYTKLQIYLTARADTKRYTYGQFEEDKYEPLV